MNKFILSDKIKSSTILLIRGDGMKQFKLAAIDMDGTLLNDNSEISERNQYALNQLIKNGVKVIIATGRAFKLAQPFVKEINLDLPIITYNGSVIKKILSEELIYSSKINMEAVKHLLDFSEKNDIYTKVYVGDMLYVASEDDEALKIWKSKGVPYKVVDSLSKNIKESPNMISFIDTPEKIKKLREQFWEQGNKELSFTSSVPHVLEITEYGVSKGSAVERVCRELNISREEVLTIGNSLNDIEMLKWAGTGIAMKNSDEELLKRHTLVSSHTNDEDGVYHILKEFGMC